MINDTSKIPNQSKNANNLLYAIFNYQKKDALKCNGIKGKMLRLKDECFRSYSVLVNNCFRED